MNIDVSNASKQQSEVVNDMTKNISGITDISESIGRGSQEITELFSKLEEQSQLIHE